MPGVYHAPYPNCYRCPVGLTPETCAAECLDFIEHQLFVHLVSPDEVAAIVVEPIQGEGGYVVPPTQFHQRLRELTTKHGILLVVDEVQSGMGRTGKMFAHRALRRRAGHRRDRQGHRVGPAARRDAARGRRDGRGRRARTRARSAATRCRAPRRSRRSSCCRSRWSRTPPTSARYLLDGLRGADGQAPAHRRRARQGPDDRRRAGADRDDEGARHDERDAVVEACFRRGLLVLGAGKNAIRLSPPLVLTKEQADTALELLDEAIGEVSTKSRGRHVGLHDGVRGPNFSSAWSTRAGFACWCCA